MRTIPGTAIAAIRDEFYDATISSNYSGRGMYGKTCLSISGSDEDIFKFRLWLCAYFAEDGNVSSASYSGIADVAGDWEMTPAHDSMGMGQVAYWSLIQVDDDPDASGDGETDDDPDDTEDDYVSCRCPNVCGH